MRGVRIFIATISILTVGVAAADEIKPMTAFDFLLGCENLIGQSVQIDDCNASDVSIDGFLCRVKTETGNAGAIAIFPDKLPKKKMSYGLQKCGNSHPKDNCVAIINGIAKQSESGMAQIEATEIIWQAEKK